MGAVHVMIATAGALSPDPAASITARLVGDDGRVTVITVVEVPRTFLDEINGDEWRPMQGVDPTPGSAEEAAFAYLTEKGLRLSGPLMASLESRGLDAESRFVEGSDPASAILEEARRSGVDVIVMGATKNLFEEWDSITARVTGEFGRPVVVIPTAAAEDATSDD